MKRNNIFMLAYITFMLLSVVIRLFFSFELWEPLILAISVSSIFFAADGLCNSVSRSVKGFCDIASDFIEESKNNCHKDGLFLAKLDKIAEEFEGKDEELPDVIRSYEPLKRQHEQMVQGIEKFDLYVSSRRNDQHRYEKRANVLAYVGFLSLFLMMIIEPHIGLPAVMQEIISVASFAIVLFSQLVDGIADERCKNDLNEEKNALKKQEELREALKIAEEKFDQYIEWMTTSDNETEEEVNAD